MENTHRPSEQLYLHAGEADPQRGRRAMLTLADLHGLLLLGGIVPVLLRAHLQVQHAGHPVPPRQVLQQDEFWWSRVKEPKHIGSYSVSVKVLSHHGHGSLDGEVN